MVEYLWQGYAWPGIIIVAQILAILVPLLIFVAYLTYAERKVIGAMQLRKGPNVVGPFGLLQPFADAVKLLFKETILPAGANRVVFVAAPMLTFILAMIGWAVIPFDEGWVRMLRVPFVVGQTDADRVDLGACQGAHQGPRQGPVVQALLDAEQAA